MFSRHSRPARGIALRATAAAGLLLGAMVTATATTQVSREADIATLRLGQRVLVDDGSCPAGQIKEVKGVALTPTGVTRSRTCVPRRSARR
ncbi:MAG: DUF6719 family protein [Xanthobacteraceae bacterium]